MADAQEVPGPNRTKLDNYVKDLLTLMYQNAGSIYQEGVQVHDTGEVRWFEKAEQEALVQWIKATDDAALAQDLQGLNLNQPNPSNDKKLTATAFCQHLYHVRGITNDHINQGLEKFGFQDRGKLSMDKTIEMEHFPGAVEGCLLGETHDANGKPIEKKKTEIVCVGAFAVVQFENGRIVMDFAHNENPNMCSHSLKRDHGKHAEMALLTDLAYLFKETKDMKKLVIIYLSTQPCHNSTSWGNNYALEGDDNVSCCNEIRKFLDGFNTPNTTLQITIKIAYFHKVHWVKQRINKKKDTYAHKQRKTQTNMQIKNAWEGFSNLLKTKDLKVCNMTTNDWRFLVKYAVQQKTN